MYDLFLRAQSSFCCFQDLVTVVFSLLASSLAGLLLWYPSVLFSCFSREKLAISVHFSRDLSRTCSRWKIGSRGATPTSQLNPRQWYWSFLERWQTHCRGSSFYCAIIFFYLFCCFKVLGQCCLTIYLSRVKHPHSFFLPLCSLRHESLLTDYILWSFSVHQWQPETCHHVSH